jgi:rifampicin phosphotransferase
MTMTGIERVGSIADVAVEDIALVGNKAATFAALRRAGFPVPEAVVLTTDALAYALVAAGLGDGARQAAIEAMSLPANLTHALPIAVERLGSDRGAVRSCGVEKLRGPDRVRRTW